MTIRIDTTKKALAKAYANLGTYFGLATDDPGGDAQPSNEAPSGGTYERVPSNWSVSDTGVASGQCTISADAGTYSFAIVCSDAAGDTMIDNCPIPPITLVTAGQIVLDLTYTQT